jgi:choline dehydrogenase
VGSTQIVLQYTAPGSAERNDLQGVSGHSQQQPALSLSTRLMRPHSRGWLRLVQSDPLRQPEICLNLASEPEDIRRLTEGFRVLCALVRAQPLARLHTGTVTLGDGRELSLERAKAMLSQSEAMEAYIRHTVIHYVHPVGTARMGPDSDAGAVVDQHCRVYGVDGLRVVDASVMPNIPRANTNLTCIMIGERVADWMREASDG